MPDGRWRMHAHRYSNGDLHNLGELRYVEHHGLKSPIIEVNVVEVADDDPAATHWGWIRAGAVVPIMIYPREVLFRICFPYGPQAEVDAGRGRVVRLAVIEIEDVGEAEQVGSA